MILNPVLYQSVLLYNFHALSAAVKVMVEEKTKSYRLYVLIKMDVMDFGGLDKKLVQKKLSTMLPMRSINQTILPNL